MGRHQAPDAPASDHPPAPPVRPLPARPPVADEPPTERLDPVPAPVRPEPPFLVPRAPAVGATRWDPAPAAARTEVLGPPVPAGGEPAPFVAPRAPAAGATRWDPVPPDDATATFSGALLSGLGGAPEPVAGPPPTARSRAVARVRRLAARVAALRGDERTAMLAVGAVVGLVLLLLTLFVAVARLTGGASRPAGAAPAPTPAATGAVPSPTATPEPSPTGPPLPPSGGTFAARHSNLCLGAQADRTDAGAQLVQRTCGTDSGTEFLLVARDQPDTYELVNVGSSRCVDVYGASVADNTPVVQWDCNGGPNQAFRLRPLADATGQPSGYVQLVAVHSGKCLDVAGLSTAENTPIAQWGCRDPESEAAAGNQSWRFSPD